MVNKFTIAVLVILAIGLQSALALTKWKAEAFGKNEVPTPVFSKAYAELTFTENNGQLTGSLLVKNVVNGTMLHIHVGNKTTNGPVAFWVWPTDTNAPSGQPISGVWRVPFYSNSTLLNPGAGISYATFLSLLKTKGLYLNLHTTAFPAGEARGQVVKDSK